MIRPRVRTPVIDVALRERQHDSDEAQVDDDQPADRPRVCPAPKVPHGVTSLALRLPENAVWAEDQDQHEHAEGDHVTKLVR